MQRPLALLPVAILAAACGGAVDADSEASEDELTTSYGDLSETLPAADLDRWRRLREAIVTRFDRMCGDTICSGDYSNLRTIHFTCSSTTKARKLKACTWILGGSIEYVDGRTGKITTDVRAFECKIPVAGTAKQLLDTLEPKGADALLASIPGTGKSFYDGLVDCFTGVVGAPPPVYSAEFYVELSEHLWSTDGDAAAWDETRRRLGTRFNDFVPLRFVCSMNRNTNRVARCSWSFVAGSTTVGAGGALVARTTTKTCNVEIGATAPELIATLAGDDPLRAKLPGRATSIYDALGGCL